VKPDGKKPSAADGPVWALVDWVDGFLPSVQCSHMWLRISGIIATIGPHSQCRKSLDEGEAANALLRPAQGPS